MSESDKTVLDPGATMPNNDKAPDLTVLEPGAAEPDLTVLEPGAAEPDLTVLEPGAAEPDLTVLEHGTKAPDLTVLEPGTKAPDLTVLEPGTKAPDLTVLEPGTKAPDLTVLEPGPAETPAAREEKPAAGTSGDYRPGDLVLGIYRVESQAIESGGMGRVWRVRHTGWNSDLAMKRPRAEFFTSEKHKADFTRECEEWIRLGLHANIVSCYYVREVDGVPSIFSEWMNGGSLAEAIESGSLREGEPGPVRKKLLDVAIQFARGLRHAHERQDADGRDVGIIHQDVKPGNVLLTKDGAAKVSDFGLARAHAPLEEPAAGGGAGDGDGRTPDDTRTKYAGGGGYTPAYCSMEQMDGQKLTRRTDIYSWAVSVMEMFLGSRPWTNGVVAGLKCAEYLGAASPALPEALRELLTQCLAAEQESRPHDFGLVEKKLLEIYESETGEAYFRPPGAPAKDTASSLNNRALSHLDLGKPEEAEKCWARALEIIPDHADSVYNHAIFQWMRGETDDLEVMRRLDASSDNNSDYYLAAAQLNRGDAYEAQKCLARMKSTFGETDDVRILSELTAKIVEEKRDGGRLDSFYIVTPKNFIINPHYLRAKSIKCSPDGGKVLIAITDGLSYVDLDMKKVVSSVKGVFSSASLSPDGRLAMTAFEHNISVFDLTSGECLKTVKGPLAAIRSVCWCPDGKTALLVGGRGITVSWDVDGGSVVRHLASGLLNWTPNIHSLCVDPGGGIALSGGGDGLVRMFRVDADKPPTVFGWHGGPVESVEFSSDGKKILSTGGGLVRLWDASTGRCLRTYDKGNWKDASVCFLPDGLRLLADVTRTGGKVTDRRRTLEIGRVPDAGRPYYVQSKIHMTDVAIGQRKLFDSTVAEIRGLIAEKNISRALEKLNGLSAVRQYGDSQTYYDARRELAGFCVRRPAGVTATESAKIKNGRRRLPALAFDQTGDKFFLSEALEGVIILYDLGTGRGAPLLWCHKTGTSSYYEFDDKTPFCLSDDKKKILAAVHRKTREPVPVVDQWALELYDAGTGETLQEFEGLEKQIRAVCLSPNGRSAATLSYEKERLKIWDVGTGKCVASLMNVEDTNVTGVSYSPDGKMMVVALHPWLVSKNDSVVVVVMDAGTQEILHKFENKNNSDLVAAPVFNPEGTAVFSVSDAIEAWDLSTGRQIKRIPVASRISHLCHSPDGKIILAAGADALHLFDACSGGLLQTIALSGVGREPVDDVCFSSDGTKIAVSRGGEIIVDSDGTKMAASRGGEIIVFELEQDLDFPGWADWDDGASPFVETFLTLRPNHTEADFFDLLAELGRRGYGWLRPDGVRARVAALVKKRKKGFFSSLFGKK